MTTVFDRCGGFDGIRKLVGDFYRLVLDTPSLRRYFDGVDMAMLHDHQAKFIAWVMEGPVNFNDETLRRAHVHLGIKRAEFLEIVGLMRRALEGNGMSAPDVDHVVRAVMRREPLIVSEAEGGAPPTG